ncbi:hypothetical protein [Umezawaea sp.]|uniref:hypothetical protein n=1 Tax=Umezawaea sp. TaxID=1955258 RepID=UPI002ED6421D
MHERHPLSRSARWCRLPVRWQPLDRLAEDVLSTVISAGGVRGPYRWPGLS